MGRPEWVDQAIAQHDAAMRRVRRAGRRRAEKGGAP